MFAFKFGKNIEKLFEKFYFSFNLSNATRAKWSDGRQRDT